MITKINFIDEFQNWNYIVNSDIDNLQIIINIFGLDNYNLEIVIFKIKSTISTYSDITGFEIYFDNNINTFTKNKIISKLNDVLYTFYPQSKPIIFFNTEEETKLLYNEITKFKNIVMQPPPIKNNLTYLNYVNNNIPKNYMSKIYDISCFDKDKFPLCYYVNKGSNQNAFFVHIYPKNVNKKNKDIFLIGKALTFDTGGINLKTALLEELKIDMTGSALLLRTLNLLNQTDSDKNLNIHLLIPIVVNDIGPNAYLPGSVLKATNGKTIEIINTDAEGRLTIVDALNFINLFLLTEFDIDNNKTLILDVATLTGNVTSITANYSAVIISNNKGKVYSDKLIKIGDEIAEYLQNIELRQQVLNNLKTPNADIANIAQTLVANCLVGGVFLNYFCNNDIPWIHIDIGIATYKNRVQTSYGINLLYQFFKQINNY
jgi:leucyl aminopeptidase